MYLTGMPQRIKNLKESNPLLQQFFLISHLGLRDNPQTYFTNNIIDRAPIFNLKTPLNMEIQINTLNQFTFNMEKGIIIYQEKMGFFKSIMFGLNMAKKDIQAGLPYNKQILIFGDFVYNPVNQVLRCYRIRQLGQLKDYSDFRFQFTLTYFFGLLFKLGVIVSLSTWLYKSYNKINQDFNKEITKVLVSQQHQTLTCYICKDRKANIIFQPCFHLNSCQECSNDQDKCPICREFIQKKQKVFND
ncbi:unnamed protein product [Paramecium sonneborni]|uniref:RING-type domain-containing protein n=1 Tax=Paramecium sonneborni TaxID=65129 RepID=A0A8S1RJA8_9CILI|nr:unnamed protein product [Paramecium sonneborni]